jgi:hypothetical protein
MFMSRNIENNMQKTNKLLIFLLILSLMSCKTIGNKRPTVKKPRPKISSLLSKNKNKKGNQNSYYNPTGSFFPKDLDKAFKNFTNSTSKFFNNSTRNFQISMKKLTANISRGISSFYESVKKFFNAQNKNKKPFNFSKWWNDFYNKYIRKK